MSPRREIVPVATAEEALGALSVMLGWNGGWVPLFIDDGVSRETVRYRKCEGSRLALWLREAVRVHDGRFSRDVAMGLPESKPEALGASWSTVLWCWIEGKDQSWRAGQFRPLPSMVLRVDGSSRRLLLWWLDEAIPYMKVAPANKRIAYRLHAPQKWAEPEKLRVPLPGSYLRVGRKRPAAILVTRLEHETFSLGRVIGGLKDPPAPAPPDRWGKRR